MVPFSVTLSDLQTRFQGHGHGIIISVYAADARSVCDSYKFLFIENALNSISFGATPNLTAIRQTL